jgi:CO dehydrogenase maturation factor
MSKTITIVGKGGVGKTAISSLIIDMLSKKGIVLATDADPSTNLNDALGLPLNDTVGKAREDLTDDIQKGKIPPGIAKQDVLDMKIREALVESDKVDLLAMGRPEGPGCYCAANHMLRLSIDRMAKNYDYVVMDCEAGMEHISRQTTQNVDYLLIISDPTMRGITAAGRMKELIKEMRTSVGKVVMVVNRVKNGLPEEISKAVSGFGMDLVIAIPEDPDLSALEIKGKPIIELGDTSPLRQGVKQILDKLGL